MNKADNTFRLVNNTIFVTSLTMCLTWVLLVSLTVFGALMVQMGLSESILEIFSKPLLFALSVLLHNGIWTAVPILFASVVCVTLDFQEKPLGLKN